MALAAAIYNEGMTNPFSFKSLPSLPRLGLFVLLTLGIARGAYAGGGPENLFLVVNGNSVSSKSIANHYIRLRNIPASNVLYINWRGKTDICIVKDFRSKLLKPALDTINKRGLGGQIDYLVYSSDLPWRVNMWDDFRDRTPKLPKTQTPIASLTGATYLWQMVLGKSDLSLGLNSNWYVPEKTAVNLRQCVKLGETDSREFRSRYGWLPGGQRSPNAKQGVHYLLSTMLGVTSGRGNTQAEVIEYLTSAVRADATQPGGTFYFTKNKDVRSVTRHACFPTVVEQLKALGAKAEIRDGILPKSAKDVMGLTVGKSVFDLKKSKVEILPGAICEHLTSAGGVLSKKASQTPLTEFLRAGAAGASGTVQEPFAIQAKFPLPTIQVHYRRGCSLAESFYQSVASPYQLLIVGDPLCQPWAKPPVVELKESPGRLVSGTVVMTPTVRDPTGATDTPIEVFANGRLIARSTSGRPISFDTKGLANGHHELRFVASAKDSVAAQGRLIMPLIVKNKAEQSIVLGATPSDRVRRGRKVILQAMAPGATEVTFLYNSHTLGKAPGPKAQLEIDTDELGEGPVRLQAVAQPSGAVSAPFWLRVEAPPAS